jgi:hypothetical protein
LTTAINGNTGTSNLTAFYQGDSTYEASTPAAIPLAISNFALSSAGITAPAGSAAIAPVTVNAARNYTALIALACATPSNLPESACFVNPNSVTGTGNVSLTVNTTPAHPLSSKRGSGPGWLAAGGGMSLACVLLLGFPRRRWRGITIVVFAVTAIARTAIGCGGAAGTDPGTAKGTYMVVVTDTAGSGQDAY